MSCLQHMRLPQWGACIIICMFTISAGVSNVHCSDYATLRNILFAHLLMWFRQSKHYNLNYQACAHSIQLYLQAHDQMWITSSRRHIFNPLSARWNWNKSTDDASIFTEFDAVILSKIWIVLFRFYKFIFIQLLEKRGVLLSISLFQQILNKMVVSDIYLRPIQSQATTWSFDRYSGKSSYFK